MIITRYMSKRAIRITTALALIAVMSVIAASLLMTGAGGATAFNADASDAVARHIPIPAQYTAQCSNGIAVPNPADNPGLVADCAVLLASRDTLEGTRGYTHISGKLTWYPNHAISGWSGVTVANNRVSRLSLNYRGMNGTIPDELGNLDNLYYLSLFRNDLTGEIPAELSNLSNLETLDIEHNELTGEIPAELGNLSNLRDLGINNNQLSGEIPAELGNLSNLWRLSLHDNQLSGEIPVQLGNLDNIGWLLLHNNNLTGAIPPELGNLPSLNYLTLRDNRFTGCIPQSLQSPLGDREIQRIGLPICSETTAATPTPTATSVPSATATPTPTATSVSYDALMSKLIAIETQHAELANLLSVLESQLAELANRLTALEGASAMSSPTPTPTATPSPTPTSVAGTSGGNACVTPLAGSASVTGRWTPDCLSANSFDETYYSRFYTFTLDAAARVTITLSSATAAPYLYLLDGAGTDGAVRLSNGDVSTSVAITANLPPGAYTIEASTWYSETYGDFTLELEIR